MSEIDSTELSFVLVGALLILTAISGIIEVTVNYTLPDWLSTALYFGLIIGYYQFKE